MGAALTLAGGDQAAVGVAARRPARPPRAAPASPRPPCGCCSSATSSAITTRTQLFPLLAAPLARRGIQMTHVNTPAEALVADKLAHYDGIVIYGNHETITPEQEQALVDFVEGGKGAHRHPLGVVHVPKSPTLHPDGRRRSSSATARASSRPRSCSRTTR